VDLTKSMTGIVATADTLISWMSPFVCIDNFTNSPVRVSAGQSLGWSHNPNNWLDCHGSMANADYAKLVAHAALLRSLTETQSVPHNITFSQDQVSSAETTAVHSHTNIESKAQQNATEPDDLLATEPVEGGLKTVELPEDPVELSKVLEVLDLSPDLSADQKSSVEQVILSNLLAFALDGRLGNYPEKINIPVKPGTEPASLPPFPSSLAKREAIDKQMDQWIQLGIIEPSKSPWGPPAFIVYRNGKPCMVFDL